MQNHHLYLLNDALEKIDLKMQRAGIAQRSSLGVWALMAYLSHAYEGTLPANVEDMLGMAKGDALTVLDTLREEKPEALSFALGAWAERTTESVGKFLERAGGVQRKPNQDDLDAWTKDKTLGIFEKFPEDITPEVKAVVTSVVATDITWKTEFKRTGKTELARLWDVESVLTTGIEDLSHSGVSFFKDDQSRYISFCKDSDDGSISVYSVIALDDNRNLSAVATQYAADTAPFEKISPQQAVDDAVFCVMTEKYMSKDEIQVSLPAWEVSANADLTSLFPEFDAISKELDPELFSSVKQFVKASYFREGFKAAAVTSMMLRATSIGFQNRHKVYALEFSKPYAVCAVANMGSFRLPLFSFEVNSAKDA